LKQAVFGEEKQVHGKRIFIQANKAKAGIVQ
jgi:hypothetical protein